MLNSFKIKNLTPKKSRYKVADGNGLFILISPNGSKHWKFKYRFADREKSLSFGKFPTVSLLEARSKCLEAHESLRQNIDPSLKRQAEKRQIAFKHDHSFQAVAKSWHETNYSRWNPKHAAKVWRRLEMHVIPVLGKLPVADIKPLDLLTVLKMIEGRGSSETCHRVLWICNRVFRFAIVIGATESNPAAHIGEGLKPNRGGHFPTITPHELPSFLRSFDAVNARAQDKLAFRLLLLTALRTGELRFSKWSDIRIDVRELHVRPEVMKMKAPHIVPLSMQSMALLGELHKLTGHQEWLFPNPVAGKYPVMSENVVNIVIEKMGYKGRMVGHSFRKLFSTILNEHRLYSPAIERQLAHKDRDSVRGVYDQSLHLSMRHELMQWWADYLDSIQSKLLTSASADLQNSGVFLPPATPPRPHLMALSRIDAFSHAAVPGALAHPNL